MANLFSNLINTKPQWESEKPEVRRQAVATLTDENSDGQRDEILAHIATNDTNSSVRQTAIEQLNDPERLVKLSGQEPELVQQRLVQLCKDSENSAQQTIAAVGSNSLLLALASESALPAAIRQLAAEKITDKARLKAIAASDTPVDVRKLLLQASTTFSTLSQLHLDHPNNTDITDRLDALTLDNPDHIESRATQISDQLDKLVKHGNWDDRKEAIEACRKSWKAIQTTVSDDAVERMARIETMLAAALSTKQDLQARTKPDDNVLAIQQGKTDITEQMAALADTVTALTEQPAEAELISHTDKLHELIARWKTLDAADANTAEFEQQMLLERYTQKRQSITAHLDSLADSAQASTELEAWLTDIEQRESIADLDELKTLRTAFKQLRRRMLRVPPEWIARGEGAIKRLSAGLEDSAAAIEDKIKTLKQTVSELEHSLSSGESAKAAQLYQQACQQLSKAPMAEGSKKTIEAKLKKAQRDLKEINKWAHWAHNKDRRKLCDELEKLAKDNTPAPDKLAKLQAARKEWKELEAAEFTNNEHAAGKELWGRFNAAATKVYAACEAYVKKRDANQDKTLNQVQKRIAALQTINADNDDERLREHTKTANQLRRALRSLSDLPPNKRGAVAKKIKSTLADSQDIITTWQERNAKRKQRLIELAKQANNERELDAALNKAKGLQNDWKSIGPATRKIENELWDEFKAAVDTVYARLNEKRDAERAELNQVFDQLRAALKAAQTALQQPDDLLDEAKATFKKSESVFDEQDVRHKVADAIRRDFDRCKRDFEKRLKQRRQAKQKQQLTTLANLANKLNAVEIEQTTHDSATESIESSIAELTDVKLQKAMQKRWDKIAKTGNHADNKTALEALALEMEVLTDTETPAAFKADRMALQVQRLSNAFGGGQANQGNRTLKQCEQQWYTIGPVASEDRHVLEKRLQIILRSKTGA